MITIVVVAMVGQASVAQPNADNAKQSAASLPDVEPTAVHFLNVSLGEIASSADGEAIHAQVEYASVNAWDWLVQIWPRVVVIPAAVVLLFLLCRVIRIIQHPQQPGKPYCRKCSYALVGNTSPKCPECGTSLEAKTPRTGKTRVRRLIVPLTVVILMLTGLIGSNIIMPGLPEGVRSWRFWPSRTLAAQLMDQSSFLAWITPDELDQSALWLHEELWTIQINNGKVIGSVEVAPPINMHTHTMMSPSLDWYTYDMRTTPDNRTALLRRGASINVIDLVGEQPVRMLRSEDDSSQGMSHDMESERVAVSSDGKTVFTGNAFNEIFGWSLTDRAPLTNPGVEVIRFKSAPTNPDDQPFYHVWDTANGRRRVFVFSGEPVSFRNAAISQDGRRMYLQNHPGQRVDVIDIDSRTTNKSFRAPSGATFDLDGLALSSNEQWAAVVGHENIWRKVFLRDLKNDRWIAKLDVPLRTIDRIMFSADDRYLIMHGLGNNTTLVSLNSEFVAFDIKQVMSGVNQNEDQATTSNGNQP